MDSETQRPTWKTLLAFAVIYFRFNNTTSVVWTVAFGRGKRYGADVPGVLEAMAGGWEASTIEL